MVQKRYTFQNIDELEMIVSEIAGSSNYKTAAGVLLQLNNPKIDTDDDAIISCIRSKCAKACLVGITSANIADEAYDIKGDPIELNVSYFEKTRLIPFCFDTRRYSGFAAGRVINVQLQGFEDIRCMQVCYSCKSANIQAFLNEFSHHGVPIFGAKAGRSIRALNAARVYGDKVYEHGIVVILFKSDSLRLYMDNSLGFREIGLEMTVTEIEGDHIIKTIDHKPATEVYSKYLNVRPGRYFVENVCEFPLVFHRKDCLVARVPSACGEDGSILFTSDVIKGEHFRLSYGIPENLFGVIERSVEGLKTFAPEAVYLFECGNRVRFLKGEATRETGAYLQYAPNASVAIGYAELFFAAGGSGSVLNSAMVAVGLSEDGSKEDMIRCCVPASDAEDTVAEREDTREYIPLKERILYFFERTSLELDAVNKELGRVAYTDRLTRIYNRWELEHKIEELLSLFGPDESDTSLIFMDIDHFKHVNDTFGHDVGDLVLRGTVDLIKEQLEPSYVFGRWGGEEFICILPGTDLKAAADFAEKLRAKVDENCYVKVRHATMSFGVTKALPGDTKESFVKRADEALYEAKETGRNRVVIG